MAQTRRQSLTEVVAGVVVGYLVAVAAAPVILPVFGFRPSVIDSFGIAASFTVLSMIRGYAVRRFFNWWHR